MSEPTLKELRMIASGDVQILSRAVDRQGDWSGSKDREVDARAEDLLQAAKLRETILVAADAITDALWGVSNDLRAAGESIGANIHAVRTRAS